MESAFRPFPNDGNGTILIRAANEMSRAHTSISQGSQTTNYWLPKQYAKSEETRQNGVLSRKTLEDSSEESMYRSKQGS